MHGFDKAESKDEFFRIRPLAKVFLCHGLTPIFTDFLKIRANSWNPWLKKTKASCQPHDLCKSFIICVC